MTDPHSLSWMNQEPIYPKRESKGWTVFCYLVPLVMIVGILVAVNY